MNTPASQDVPLAQVLLVDDDQVNLMLTSAALSDQGFRIIEADSGEAALRLLMNENAPDVVVLDAMMPGLDGFETCRRVRLLPGFENMPVLMLTGLDDDQSINRAYQAGATDFFVKSNQWSLLAGRLRYLLRSARTRQELERSKAKLARAQDLARMGSFDWRPVPQHAFGQLQMSHEGLRVFGMDSDEQVSLRALLRAVVPGERGDMLRQLSAAMRMTTVVATDVHMNLPDGRERIMHVEAEPEFNEHGHSVGYTGIVQDVTDRRMAEDRIRHLANYDALTGLPNRRHLMWRTERALEHARRLQHPVALLLVDLDRFKLINDTLGHLAGDELLVEAARRLRQCVRHTDNPFDGVLDAAGSRSHRALEAVGRLGGDEFVALLPEVTNERDAQRVARRILESMREPIYVSGQECFITTSVGIALFPRDGQSVADLMRNSDVAMYSVKSSGRNNMAVYDPQLAGRGREKLELESALHKALERQELVLHYQPKIDVGGAGGTGLVGVEALMRWRRGDRLVAPADFIPLAEETGLIVPMTEWALFEAARQAARWRTSFGFNESVAVNIPTRMFEKYDLVELVHDAVTAADIPHRMIKLEITETGLMKNLQGVVPTLHQLNELGVEISIDDFGTGYSSLSYLTSLPISELKIDRSFVNDLGVMPQSSAVVSAIIALARSLGLQVVAEGVEKLGQMEVLNRLGCSQMQGWLFNKALPPDDLDHWIHATLLKQPTAWLEQLYDAEASAAGKALDHLN